MKRARKPSQRLLEHLKHDDENASLTLYGNENPRPTKKIIVSKQMLASHPSTTSSSSSSFGYTYAAVPSDISAALNAANNEAAASASSLSRSSKPTGERMQNIGYEDGNDDGDDTSDSDNDSDMYSDDSNGEEYNYGSIPAADSNIAGDEEDENEDGDNDISYQPTHSMIKKVPGKRGPKKGSTRGKKKSSQNVNDPSTPRRTSNDMFVIILILLFSFVFIVKVDKSE